MMNHDGLSQVKTLVMVLLVVVAATAQTRAPRPQSNVILITVDTLRADRLGCYGYKSIETPNMDRLAAEGARFSTAVAQVPMTLPSHCTILTGTYPTFHKVRDNVGYRLDDSMSTIAELLKPRGFQTGAFVGSYVLDSKFGLNQGFDLYYDHFDPGKNPDGFPKLDQLERRGEEVMRHTLQWMESAAPKGPFFAWVHLYDPHDPYEPPEPFKTKYRSRLYDGEIAYVDLQIGKLLAFLDSRKLYDKTTIVLVGDHGESFGEHNEVKHGYFIYDTTLLVPFIVKPCSVHPFRGVTVRSQVRLTDVVPTILQMLDLPKGQSVQGTGLLSLMLGKQTDLRLEAYSETYYPAQFGGSSLRSLRLPNNKFIDAPRPELYDLMRDPQENVNIQGKNQALAGELKRRLNDIASMYAGKISEEGAQVKVDSEQVERLAALGYVGGVVRGGTAGTPANALPDPKDRVELFRLLNDAGRDAATGRCREAEPQLQKAIDQAPGIPTTHFLLGRCYFTEQKFEQAYVAFQQLLKLSPESAEAQFYVSACEFYLNRLDSAEAGLRKVLSINPGYGYAYKYLGLIYTSRNQPQQAMQAFQLVLDILPSDEEAHFRLGFLLARQSRLEEAIVHFKKATEINPSNPVTHKNLGLAYLKTNQKELGERELAEACRLDRQFCP
jgi:arylsulfatase A-like enzyme/Tfp pilus assembly protein PilF